jgi:hypothetical protein
MHEAKALAVERLRELEGMPFDELRRFVDEPLTADLIGPSGSVYRCRTYAFWDMDPEDSELMVEVTVKGRGLAFLRRYRGVEVRTPDEGAEDRPDNDPDVTSTYVVALTQAGCLAGALGVLVGLVGGFAYAVSRVARWF